MCSASQHPSYTDIYAFMIKSLWEREIYSPHLLVDYLLCGINYLINYKKAASASFMWPWRGARLCV